MANTLEYIVYGTGDPSYVAIKGEDNTFTGTNEFDGTTNFDGATDFDGTNTFDGATVLNGALTGTSVKDEDNMASDSATAVPTQQSTKAYVDTHAADTSTHGVAQVADNADVTNKMPLAGGTFTGDVLWNDDTNYIKVTETTGQISWGGTYKKKLSMRPAFVAGSIAGAGKPTAVDVGVWAGYSMPISDGTDDEVLYWRLTVPGRWDGASDIIYTAIVCLSAAETEGDDFKFQLDWNHTDGITGAIDATTVQNLTDTGDCIADHNAQYSVFKLEFTIDWDIDNPDIVAGDILAGKLFRIASGGTEVSNEIIVLDHWLTFTVDKVFKIA